MESTVRPSEEFGRDHGLLHEVVVALRGLGGDRDFWVAMADPKNRPEITRFIALLTGPRITAWDAWNIMREGFYGPPDWHLSASLSVASIVPFSRVTLEAARRDHILLWSPGLSVAQLYEQHPELFDYHYGKWFLQSEWAQVPLEKGWHLVRTHSVPNTHNRTLRGQKTKLAPGEQVATARQIVNVWIARRLRTHRDMIPSMMSYIRTSDTTRTGGNVVIGGSGNGLGITGSADGKYRDCGLASAHKREA